MKFHNLSFSYAFKTKFKVLLKNVYFDHQIKKRQVRRVACDILGGRGIAALPQTFGTSKPMGMVGIKAYNIYILC